ncbi:hypothetical protein Barb6XT_00530 [Bacteroidales bacterium Barb6XT]|nr:hypothetical protein Barb6XT_00530 [Bacteroidales bacterium Barb6XT]
MKKVALISMAVLFSLTGIQRVQAQKALRNKQVYLEYFGPGVVSSASFDSRFKERGSPGVRILGWASASVSLKMISFGMTKNLFNCISPSLSD